MNKIKNMICTIGLVVGLLTTNAALAEGIGYLDMEKIQTNYPEVQKTVQEISQKELALQEYLLQKEKESKNITTPVAKKNFEEKVAKEFKAKKDNYLKFKAQKEEEIFNKIQTAARNVLVEQKLDAVVDSRFIFVGGIDISDLVITKLKTTK